MTGRHPEYEGVWVAHEIQGQDVLFSRMKETGPSQLKVWLKSIRVVSLTATMMPSLAILLWVHMLSLDVDWLAAVCAVLGVMTLQISVNLFNDVEDYLKLIDLPGSLGGSGVIQQGWLSAQQVRKGALIALFIGCALGLPALLVSPQGILTCGILAVIGVVGYSGKPFNFKYKAMGDLAVFALCGPILTMGMSYAATGTIQEGVILIGSFFGFAAAAILNANNMNDIKVDTSRGATTFASILGFKFARNWQFGYYLGAYICLLLLVGLSSEWILLPLITFPLVMMQIKKLKSTNDSSAPSLAEVRFDAAKLHLLLGVILCSTLIGLITLG
jgi:1,4-dihydroxy-2-naphthoate octaprenyltransferase